MCLCIDTTPGFTLSIGQTNNNLYGKTFSRAVSFNDNFPEKQHMW